MIKISLFRKKENTTEEEWCNKVRVGNKYIELTNLFGACREPHIHYWKYNPRKDVITIISYGKENKDE